LTLNCNGLRKKHLSWEDPRKTSRLVFEDFKLHGHQVIQLQEARLGDGWHTIICKLQQDFPGALFFYTCANPWGHDAPGQGVLTILPASLAPYCTKVEYKSEIGSSAAIVLTLDFGGGCTVLLGNAYCHPGLKDPMGTFKSLLPMQPHLPGQRAMFVGDMNVDIRRRLLSTPGKIGELMLTPMLQDYPGMVGGDRHIDTVLREFSKNPFKKADAMLHVALEHRFVILTASEQQTLMGLVTASSTRGDKRLMHALVQGEWLQPASRVVAKDYGSDHFGLHTRGIINSS
jgi:hypothetical protein